MAVVAETELVQRLLAFFPAGFVGSHCVRVLLAGGFRVRGTVRDPTDDAKTAPLRELEGASERLELVAANLMKDDGWAAAVAGAMYVLHVASPFPITAPKHKDDLIRPAVDGSLRVLKAAAAEAGVRRVVLTSSVASITEGRHPDELKDRTFSEKDWSDLESGRIAAYPESKTRAERAAWEFIKSGQPEGRGLELATINPSFIVGPMIRRSPCSSVEVVQNLMERKFSIIPDVNLWCVDVRDVAEAHVRAMVLPAAAGKRFLLSTREYGLQEVRPGPACHKSALSVLPPQARRHCSVLRPTVPPSPSPLTLSHLLSSRARIADGRGPGRGVQPQGILRADVQGVQLAHSGRRLVQSHCGSHGAPPRRAREARPHAGRDRAGSALARRQDGRC